MTLKLAIEITADAKGAKAGVDAAKASLDGLKSEAASTATAMEGVASAADEASRAARDTSGQAQSAASALKAQEAAAAGAARALTQLSGQQREAAVAIRAANANSVNSASALNARLGVRDSFAGSDRAKEIADFGRGLDDLKARYSPLFAAQRQYKEELAGIREAERLGALSSAEAVAEIGRVKAAFAQAVPVLQGKGRLGGTVTSWSQLRPDQKLGIARQVPDVVGSLGMGMSMSQVAIQQGPQIIDQAGGVKNALGLLRSAITPVTVGVGLLTAAVVAGATAWGDYTGRTREAADVARAYGAATGTSAADIERAANAAAAAGAASVTVARDIATELTRSGKVGSDQFAGIIGIAKDFAAVMRTDVASASGQLGKIFGDPAAGAAQLQQLGLLDGATTRLVKSLSEQNRTQEASKVLLTAVTPRLAGAAEATTKVGRAAQWAGQQWDNLWNSVGRAVDRGLGGTGGDTIQAQLQRAQEQLARLGDAPQVGGALGSQARRRREQLQGLIADLQEQIRLENRVAANRQTLARDDQRGSAAVGVADASPANAVAAQRRQLENELTQLRAGADAGGLTDAERGRIQEAITAKSRALDALNSQQARANELARIDAQIQLERDPVVRADLAARRARLQLSGQEISTAEIEAQVEEARTRSLQESATARTLAARSILESQRGQLEQARLELSLMGQSEAARARAVALLQAEQQIRSQLIDTNSREAATIRAQAVALADLGTIRSRQSDAWQTFTSAGEQAFDALSQDLITNKDAFKNWGDVIKSVAADIGSTLLKLSLLNPLKNWFFGTNYGTISDLQGGGAGVLGSLLGGGRTAGSAVTAASGGVGAGAAAGSVGAGVLALSRSYTGLNETRDNGAIRSILSASGTAALDPAQQAWCAAYANAVLAKSGMAGTGSNMASSFLSWGQATNNPSLGDIVNLKPQAAGASGHVGFFAGRDAAGNVLVNGGNQGNGVATVPFPADQVVSFRTSLTDATTATGTFASGLGDAARSATGALGGATGGLGGAATDLGGAAGDVGTAATSFSSGLGNAFENILSGLGDALGGIGNGFSGLFSGLGGGGTVGSTVGASFALGGIMTSRGPVPLRAYANGGVANSPQLALFGEGRSPEAYVPLPDGRSIPVSLRVSGSPGQAQAAPVTVNVINNAGAQVRTETSVGRNGELQANILVDAVRQIMSEDAQQVGPITQVFGARFGMSPAGGLA